MGWETKYRTARRFVWGPISWRLIGCGMVDKDTEQLIWDQVHCTAWDLGSTLWIVSRLR